ncbi:MAG: FtsH protease activity modulator HflK [Lachnospiraceae bacterium]|jgi:membrane protease subunit HflK|nr:FtsH protease activity modulator HflK [Lachnospiraceae bacterium]RKJ49122.1 FtsH protease activity modulator HflK [bacterium 1XD42-54]
MDNGRNDKAKLLRRLQYGGIAVAVLLAVLLLGNGMWYQIEEQEEAVIVTLGSAETVSEKGLHFKIPVIQQVHKVNTTIQGFPIGYEINSNETVADEAIMITSDYNFIDVDFFVEYRISDPVKYLYASGDPERILRNIAQSSIRTVIGRYDVDSVLTTGKAEIQANIKEMILEKLEKHEIGLSLVNISIQDSEPPTQEIMKAFKAVETAKQGKETALNNANKYQNEKLPAAKAEADEIVKDAEAQKQMRINEAEAQVARFKAMYEEYEKNPVVTKQRMFFEAMEDILPDLKVIIDDGGGVQKVLPLDSFMGNLENGSASGSSGQAKQSGGKDASSGVGGSQKEQSVEE